MKKLGRIRAGLTSSGIVLSAVAIVLAGAVGVREVQAEGEAASSGGSLTMRRLDEAQYKRSIAQVFGADITVPGRFEPPVREDGMLAIGDAKVIVTPAGFEQDVIRAREISAQVLDETHRKALVPCVPAAATGFDAGCARQFLAKYGMRLFRRPLTDHELSAAIELSQHATAVTGDFYKGLGSGLSSFLVSPSFIFRIEAAEPDPARAGALRLDSWSLASRISFLLWNSPPDDELLRAAGSSELRTADGLQRQVDRLMASPRFVDGARAFFSDMFAYDQFEGLSKDNSIYPVFNPQLRKDAQEQTLRTIVNHLIEENGDYRDLLTTKKTFLSRSLGALYGVKVDARGFDGGWMPYTFPVDDPHSGLLTLPGFLMLDPSHEGRSSPTIRGKSIRENLLCQTVPMPPANVNFQIVQNTSDPVHKTARSRLTAHQDNPVCAGCHRITDPMGLSLENYDPVGRFRAAENGETIDASGKFDGKPFANSTQLMSLMHDSSQVTSCVIQRAFEYGVGHRPARAEEASLDALGKSFARDNYRFRALFRNLATSDAFQAVTPEKLASK